MYTKLMDIFLYLIVFFSISHIILILLNIAPDNHEYVILGELFVYCVFSTFHQSLLVQKLDLNSQQIFTGNVIFYSLLGLYCVYLSSFINNLLPMLKMILSVTFIIIMCTNRIIIANLYYYVQSKESKEDNEDKKYLIECKFNKLKNNVMELHEKMNKLMNKLVLKIEQQNLIINSQSTGEYADKIDMRLSNLESYCMHNGTIHMNI